jgi:hypothetical protein
MKNKTLKYSLITVGAIALLLFMLISLWLLTPYQASESATAIVQNSDNVSINNGEYILFEPDSPKEKGIIIYPGGRVEAEAYSPLAKDLADEGYHTAIIFMPLNLAVIDPLKGENVISDLEEIESWVIVGHSLGGSMAARLYTSNSKVDKLVFLAAYPEDALDLTESGGEVISIVGTNDEVVNMDNINSSKNQLPDDSLFLEIEGGNHAQFGDYGEQDGDGAADISRDEQVEQTVEFVLDFIN